MPFVNPFLLWGLIGVSAPVIIHLINLMRQRKIDWAAMEFLLQSKKRYSTWIFFKQLLLLLMRMAAIAAVVMILAQPLVRNEFGKLVGAARTHHLVLLDDSFSMSDRWGDTSAFAEAKKVVQRIGDGAVEQPFDQRFTLVTFSGAKQPAIHQATVNQEFGQKQLAEALDKLRSTQAAASPADALNAVGQLSDPAQENQLIYVVSDFRAREWGEPGELRERLAELEQAGAKIKFVRCVDQARPNLAVTALRPALGTRAAGVPLRMEVAVTNFGVSGVANVTVDITTDGAQAPDVVIDQIPAGQSVVRKFEVTFQTAGEHEVAAKLASDTVDADNTRFAVVNFPVTNPALIIDGDLPPASGRVIQAAMSPGGVVRTGISPRIESPAYLINKSLDQFSAIYLASFERLDPKAVESLEKFVRAGGGVGVFLGASSAKNVRHVNEALYRDGTGFFPVPLVAQTSLPVERFDKPADIEYTIHPLFARDHEVRDNALTEVVIEDYFAVQREWKPAADAQIAVVARLRNNAPLILDKQLGKGRIVAVLTSAAAVGNNWSRTPMFPPLLLNMHAYVTANQAVENTRPVGAPIEIKFEAGQYDQVRYTSPAASQAATSVSRSEDLKGRQDATFAETDAAGVYSVVLSAGDSAKNEAKYAVNVVAEEGDLALASDSVLKEKLRLPVDIVTAKDFASEELRLAGFNLSESILYLLIFLLIGEQLLSYALSYHPPARGETR